MSRRAETLLLAARLALVAGVVLYTVRTAVHLGTSAEHFLDNWFYDALPFVAAAVCASRRVTARNTRERTGWLLLGLGIASWAAGDAYWTHWIGNSPNQPFPSPADAGYLALFPLAYVGFILLIRA